MILITGTHHSTWAMIGRLRGKVESITEETALIDVNGVGYEVFCPARTLLALPASGGMAELTIETHVREDHIHLFGFASGEEREWFRLLTTVQGVGARIGIAILGLYGPRELAQAIAAQDKNAFSKVSGVGPKLAERIITELKSKVNKMAGVVIDLPAAGKKGKAAATPAVPSAMEEAVSALVHLGYSRMEAFAAVSAARQKEDKELALDNLIRHSLKELAR